MILFGSALACANYLVMAYLDVFRPGALDAHVEPDRPAGG